MSIVNTNKTIKWHAKEISIFFSLDNRIVLFEAEIVLTMCRVVKKQASFVFL
jgi:hypothetical protein